MKVSTRCFAVTGLGYAPPWYVNAGFIVGSETTLIVDTGANAASAATIHGYATAVSSGNRLRVINTEQHFDHVGGNSYFRQRCVEVWGHASIARTEAEFAGEIAEFNALIPNPARRNRGEASVFYSSTSIANPEYGISSDSHVDLGGCAVEILLTPGHTPSNISLYMPDDRVAYCGDCLTSGYLPNLDCGGPKEWRLWLASIKRIEEREPQVVVCGHGPVVSGDSVARLIAGVRYELEKAISIGTSPTR
jgi:glyoxylase-like metal-dependent hydrolase (beta-lactamase superfamily II)